MVLYNCFEQWKRKWKLLSYIGMIWDNGKENGKYYIIKGVYGIMEEKMETTIVNCY